MLLVPPGGGEATDQGAAPEAHKANLAEGLSESVLQAIAQTVIEGVEADVASNSEAYAAWREGLKLLGLKPERMSEPFDGASGAVDPMLKQAVVAFVAQASAEMCPANGPVRCEVIGDVTPDLEKRAQRKEGWLNYYLTSVDEDFYADCEQGWLMLALYGSVFRKVYRDPLTGQPRSRFLTPLTLVLSFNALSLEGSGRVTQVDELARSEVIRRRLAGYYRDVDLGEPTGEQSAQREVAAEAENRRPSSLPQDADHLIYECFLMLVPSEFGWEDPKAEGAPPGMPLPYIVTVDVDSRRVLRMERDWREGDILFRPEAHFAHYRFMPGLGVYGWGLLALMGATADTASVLLRQALNSFTLSSFPGGFRSKGIGGEESTIDLGPMQYPEIETGGLPIDQVIMPLPVREVPASFPALYGEVRKGGEVLGQISQMQVGEGRQDAPVGTTLALLEQAIRPTSAVLKRLHTGQRKELRLIARMFGKSPGATYPYLVDGKRGEAMAADFHNTDDVLPVSDPNIPTQVQRLALADAKLKLAMASGGKMDVRVAMRSMLRTMGVPDGDVDALMPEAKPGQPADVVTEFAMAIKGQPLAIGPAQAHDAHLAVHLAQMQTPNLPPPVLGALLAHCGDHLAALFAAQASAAAGMPLVPGQPLPPEIETQVAIAVAQASAQIMAPIAAAMAGAQQDPEKAADRALKQQELRFKAADSVRKSTETARQDQVEALVAQEETLRTRIDAGVRQFEAVLALLQQVAGSRGGGDPGASPGGASALPLSVERTVEGLVQ